MDPTELDARLASIFGPHRWIVAVDVAVAGREIVERLGTMGAVDTMVIAASEGVGELPAAPICYTRTSGDSIMSAIRAFLDGIAEPTPAVRSQLDAFDPARIARVITVPFGSVQSVAGRPVYGARPLRWEALEDKTTVHEVWRAAGVSTAPFALSAPAEAAATDLRSPLGSVWVADNREGWHGGGEYVRWVRTGADAAEAARWFAPRAHRVRVMPFLDGIPCSIHGLVTDDGVAVLRPLEMIVLRHRDASRFLYAGFCNFWDPDPAARIEMRDMARRVGEVLAGEAGYRGAFGIDGVLTADGFLPTELNPRFSAGHAFPARAAELPLGLVNRAIVAGDLELSSSWLETTLLEAGDSQRGGGMGIPMTGRYEPRRTGLSFNGDRAEAVEGADADAELSLGPGPQGSYLMMRLDPSRVAAGPSTAPLAVAAVDFARREWGVDLPAVAAAPDLRPAAAGRVRAARAGRTPLRSALRTRRPDR